MEKIVCPCCGAETSNMMNCDYCGSYLVRFIKSNHSFNDAQLGKSAECLLSIQEELQANIDEQSNTATKNHICSEISSNDYSIEIKNPRAISDYVEYKTKNENFYVLPTNPFDEDEVSIILVVRVLDFYKLTSKTSDDIKMKQLQEKQKLEWLEHIGLLGLCAKSDDVIISIEGNIGTCHSYYINFGQDIIGATRAISSFLYGNNIADKEKISFRRTSVQETVYQSKVRTLLEEKKDEKKLANLGFMLGWSIGTLILAIRIEDEVDLLLFSLAILGSLAAFIFSTRFRRFLSS